MEGNFLSLVNKTSKNLQLLTHLMARNLGKAVPPCSCLEGRQEVSEGREGGREGGKKKFKALEKRLEGKA